MVRSIIARKGPPFTRKTEFATLIANCLSCPVLSIDDVLDVLHPGTFNPKVAPDVSFDILCQMASSHLFKGAFDNVVIDSPLSSQHQLDLLIKLAKSFSILYPESKLVVVECKPKRNYSWKLKFERYLEDHTSYKRKWYKPKSWNDVEKAVRDSYDEVAGGYQVSKLVLDPSLDLPNFFDVGPSKHTLLMKAIQYMTTLKKCDGIYTVIYHQWRQSEYNTCHQPRPLLHPPPRHTPPKKRTCKGGHYINGYSQNGIEHEANCIACDEQVMGGAAYTCKDCSLALHKNCAESYGDTGLCLSELPNSQMSSCTYCKETGKSGSRNCGTCLFETNLKSRIMPTVVRHDCEKHFLSLVIPSVKNERYLCAACGDCDMSDSYSCEICNLAYHFECLTVLPLRFQHVHGDHHHYLRLNFSNLAEEEDYLCQECHELMDPQVWYYTCEDCGYELHLYCALPRKERIHPHAGVGNSHSSTAQPLRDKLTD